MIELLVVALSRAEDYVPVAEPGGVVADVGRVMIVVKGGGRLEGEALDWGPGELVTTVRVDRLYCAQSEVQKPGVKVKGTPQNKGTQGY